MPLLKPQTKQRSIRIVAQFPEELVKRMDHYGNFVREHYGTTTQMQRADIIVQATERVLNDDREFAEYMKSNPVLVRKPVVAAARPEIKPASLRSDKRE